MPVIARIVRAVFYVVLLLVIALGLAITIVPRFLDRIYYDGPPNDHFDGARFANPDGDDTAAPPAGGSRAGFLWRQLSGDDDRPAWPAVVPITPTRPPARVTGTRMLVTWIGHATVLVQTQGLNILTDPVWAERAGPFGLGPRRVAAPGVRFDDLPRIDLVLVSHNHYDHLDQATLARLWRRDRPTIVTSLGNDSVIAQTGARATALDWQGRVQVRPGITVAVTRNHHWGSRWFADRNRALWSSFVVQLPAGGNLFFAGDTGFGDGKWPAMLSSAVSRDCCVSGGGVAAAGTAPTCPAGGRSGRMMAPIACSPPVLSLRWRSRQSPGNLHGRNRSILGQPWSESSES